MPLAFTHLPAEDTLRGFSTALVYSYIAFNRTRDPHELDKVVLGVLEFYMGATASQALHGAPGGARLTRELGCKVETIADTICLIEKLFGVQFDAAEIAQLQTLDDLRQLVAGRVRRASVLV